MASPLLPSEIKDFTRVTRQELRDRIRVLYNQMNPQWEDFSAGYPENLLLEGTAFLAAVNIGVINERARQLYWATVTNRLATIRLGRPIGFSLPGRSAATLDGVFSTPNNANTTKKILLPAGLRLSSGNYTYTLLDTTTIEVGSYQSSTVSLENSEAFSETHQSDEVANWVVKLSKNDVIDGSISVVAGNGTYSNIDASSNLYASFLEMRPDTLGYITAQDSDGAIYLFFGDGVYGAIPKGALIISGKSGGGEAGRVSALASWQVLDTVYYEDGSQATVLFTNPAKSVGGFDEMTVDEARVRGPLAFRTRQRCVIEEDFEYVATGVSGIARAAFVTSERDPTVQEDHGILYLIAYGNEYSDSGYFPPAEPTTTQINEVAALINSRTGSNPALMGFSIAVQSGYALCRTINIKARIYKAANYIGTQVRASIEQNLQKYFAVSDNNRVPNSLIGFGYSYLGADGYANYEFDWSDIFNVIKDSAGVRKIPSGSNNLLLNDVEGSITLSPSQFPVLGTITLYDMDEGGVEI